jgi:hypothetical protein
MTRYPKLWFVFSSVRTRINWNLEWAPCNFQKTTCKKSRVGISTQCSLDTDSVDTIIALQKTEVGIIGNPWSKDTETCSSVRIEFQPPAVFGHHFRK